MGNNVILLKEGSVYFYPGFTDSTFTIPVISTWIYVENDAEEGHIFRDAYDEKQLHCLPPGTHLNILDRAALIEWLQVEHSPKTTAKNYVYKYL